MTDCKIFCKFTDYLILNAYSISSAGLYNGKSGIALCLLECSRHLNNETIEDLAFELLQESLALSNHQNANINVENGLSGIAFVLLYLIQNQFIDADFEELFKKQASQIQSQLKARDVFSEKDLSVIYFLGSCAIVRGCLSLG
jgi:lantibiotic modifying enzyme